MMKKISDALLNQITGGTPEAAYAFQAEMKKKYGTDDNVLVWAMMTREERQHMNQLYFAP